MNKNTIIGIIVGLVIIIGGIVVMNSMSSTPAVVSNESGTITEDMASQPEVIPTDVAVGTSTADTSASSSVKAFTVNSNNFKFAPTTIKVKKGDTVRITLNNTGGIHDLVIDEFDVRTKQLPNAGTDTVEFVADKVGTFEYYCSVGNHRQMGMVGTLTVE
jgi:plastocyanin